MSETTANQETVETEESKETNLLDTPEQEVNKEANKDTSKDTLLQEAANEEKEKQAVEDKRLLDAKDEDLSDEDKTKKNELVKSNEEKKKQEDADKKAKEVPEKYEFKIPEGMTLDQALVDKVSPLFKDAKLSQEDAQKLVNVYASHIQELEVNQSKELEKLAQEDKQETIKELGTDYKKELSYAAKVRNRLLSKETIELLNHSGLSNNVHLIKDLIKLGKSISEDTMVDGKTAHPSGDKPAGDTLYPNQGK